MIKSIVLGEGVIQTKEEHWVELALSVLLNRPEWLKNREGSRLLRMIGLEDGDSVLGGGCFQYLTEILE